MVVWIRCLSLSDFVCIFPSLMWWRTWWWSGSAHLWRCPLLQWLRPGRAPLAAPLKVEPNKKHVVASNDLIWPPPLISWAEPLQDRWVASVQDSSQLLPLTPCARDLLTDPPPDRDWNWKEIGRRITQRQEHIKPTTRTRKFSPVQWVQRCEEPDAEPRQRSDFRDQGWNEDCRKTRWAPEKKR